MTTSILISIHLLPDVMKIERYIPLKVEPTISLTEIQDEIVKVKIYSFPVENPTPLHARAIELLHDRTVLNDTNLRDHLAEGTILKAQFNTDIYQRLYNRFFSQIWQLRLFSS